MFNRIYWVVAVGVAVAAGCSDMDEMSGSSAGDGAPYAPPPGNSGGATPPPSQPGTAPSQDGETYADYGENGFVDTAEDNLATFAIDVDTASYTLMRRDLTWDQLPVEAGVRVEEYVNFFDYDYAPPRADDDTPFSIDVESAPSFFGSGLHLLRVGIQGRQVPEADRKPANLVFLVDVSGSMWSADKLGLVQYSLRELTRALRPSDTIGIVVYAGSDGVVLPPTPVEEASTVLDAIDALDAGGSTNGEAGIRTAYRLAQSAFREGGINRVVLCSDGDFNVGLTGDALVELIEEKREAGVTLSVLGFGAGNYNDRDMERLANHGNGNYAYIDRQAEADRVLREDLTATLQVIAKDVKIQVELDAEAVNRYRLIGYENRVLEDDEFRDDQVDAGEIGAGHQVTAYIEVELAPGVERGALAAVHVRYKAPDAPADEPAAGEVRRSLQVEEMGSRFLDASPGFRFGAAVAEFAEILRRSEFSDGARFEDVADIADAALRDAGWADSERKAELVGLVEKAAAIWR